MTSKAASFWTSRPEVAIKIASHLSGAELPSSEQLVRETVCELANMVIGNSVTLLNDQGFRFKVFPPEIHVNDDGLAGSADTEAMVICIETPCGDDLPEYRHALSASPPSRTRSGRRSRLIFKLIFRYWLDETQAPDSFGLLIYAAPCLKSPALGSARKKRFE